MRILYKISVAFILLIVLQSCSNHIYSTSYSPIIKKYNTELEKLSLGMTKKEVKSILPNLHMRGQTYVGNEVVEAQELQHNYWTGVGGTLRHEKMWFYFHNSKLVKWGLPNDWPTSPDLIIENRIR